VWNEYHWDDTVHPLTIDLLFTIFLKFYHQNFFYAIATFRLNSREIESNLLTKNKIERHGTKVKKKPRIGDSFKIHTKNLIQSSYFKNDTYWVS
jgi:hypothetical protein